MRLVSEVRVDIVDEIRGARLVRLGVEVDEIRIGRLFLVRDLAGGIVARFDQRFEYCVARRALRSITTSTVS